MELTNDDNGFENKSCESSNRPELSILLRPPITGEEAHTAAPQIHIIINSAYDVYKSEGVKGLRQFISNRKLEEDVNTLSKNFSDSFDDTDSKISGDPRPYQIAMAEIVKEQNTIVQLNTGLGKTLIAIMTIKNFAHDYKSVNSVGHAKQTWFLVPSVALAVQQSNTLRVNLPYSISTVCHTAAKSDEARSKLSNSNILVLTHGSALELLQHYNDMFYFSRINLVVVDECHHATKKHSYTNIFEQFYHKLSLEDHKPRVLGLTATPIINVDKKITEKGLESKLVELESILDSKIVGFSSLGMSLEESGVLFNRRSENSIYYENIVELLPSNGYPDHETIGLHKFRKKEFRQLHYLVVEYGPIVVWHYTSVLIREISRNMFEKETEEQFAKVKDHLRNISSHCKNIASSTGGKTAKLVELEKLLEKLYGDGSNKKASFEDTVGIVFVKQRISALSLKHYFNSIMLNRVEGNDSQRNIIRSGLLTRKTTHVFKYLSSSQKLTSNMQKEALSEWLHTVQDMRGVLNSLRSREINLLFATSVVEEGVDIDACSFVIVLDELQTTKSYIQMRGRARQLDAKFFVFENSFVDSKKAPLSLNDASKIDSQVSTYLGSRRLSSMEKPNNKLFNESLFKIPTVQTSLSKVEEEALIKGRYHVKNGMVDLQSSKSLVNRYCSCIPMDVHARSSRAAMKPYLPIYQNTILVLPSHLPSNIRNISLPKAFRTNSKKKNESLLALIACVRLHKNNVLNDRLLPLKRSDIQQKLQKSVLDSMKRISICKYSINLNTDDSNQIFLYPLVQEGVIFSQNVKALGCHRTLCIVSFRELCGAQHFSVDLTHHQLLKVNCSLGTCKSMKINQSQWDLCGKFYAALMNCRWRRRTGRQYFEFTGGSASIHTPFVVSCLSSNNNLDWNHMRTVVDEYTRNENERRQCVKEWNGLSPRLIVPIYNPNTTYIAMELDAMKSCASPFPSTDFSSYSDYFAKKWAFKIPEHSKLIQVQRCWELPSNVSFDDLEEEAHPLPGNHVGCGSKEFCDRLVSEHLPQDACMEAPLADPCLQLHCVMLPQILYELERNQTIHEFLTHCTRWPILTSNLEKIPFEDVTTAMTAKSCTYGQTSYDRLEYLGDAVLKVIHTDALINSDKEEFRKWFHCLHEGDLTELRTAMGCNERLKVIAESAGFDNYILTTPLGRGTWLPYGLISCHIDSKETKQSSQYRLVPSSKVVADVVESLLGLIYLQCGYDATAKVAEELKISSIRSNNSLHQLNPPEISSINEDLIKKVSELLCVDQFVDDAFVMEACTHPTSTNLSNYQRLEWIGDAALCLAAREIVFHKFPTFDVKDLVTIETILICNETLSLIAFEADLHRHIIHCDSTLPSRLEAYEFQINHEKKGLWSSDPPKVLADTAEALIGVAHIDGGISQGQKAAGNVITNMVKAIDEHFVDSSNDKNSLLMQLTHPVQALTEICSSFKTRSCNTNEFYHKFKAPLWFGRSWEHCSEDSTPRGYVGHIHFHDLNLCAIADKYSRSVAKLKASSLLHFVLNESEDLQKKLEEMTNALSD